MKIDLETSKKGNNFLGKEEATSSNLVVGSTDNQSVTSILSINNNSLRYYIGIFDCFFVPILFIHFYRNTIALPSHDDHMLNICRTHVKHMSSTCSAYAI